eukprot:jgi/Botrbrau1/5029/Bobra.0396s0042.1
MASELSKLIDDQLAEAGQANGVHAAEIQNLVKPGVSSTWKQQSLGSKVTGAIRPLWTEPWWTRDWWTKKRIIVGVNHCEPSLDLLLFRFRNRQQKPRH